MGSFIHYLIWTCISNRRVIASPSASLFDYCKELKSYCNIGMSGIIEMSIYSPLSDRIRREQVDYRPKCCAACRHWYDFDCCRRIQRVPPHNRDVGNGRIIRSGICLYFMVFLDRLWGYSKIISEELASLLNHRKYLCDFKDIISGVIQEMSIDRPYACLIKTGKEVDRSAEVVVGYGGYRVICCRRIQRVPPDKPHIFDACVVGRCIGRNARAQIDRVTAQ